MSSVPEKIEQLVERFERNIESYKHPDYNETQLRVEFANPFWEALGWDVYNKEGHAPAYRDVIHEDAIKVGGATKAPDYCFRAGGVRKFFLETKRPSWNLKKNPEPAYQLRRYAWSCKLPVSILTDFEEMAVYDGRVRPKHTDKASQARIRYFAYHDYIDQWDEIEGIFSRDAVYEGSFDKFAESTKRKRGTTEVDGEFLKEIEGWREALAKNLALRNPRLDNRELNFAVQKTIDRIIFLRMCEDRGIEDYGQLKALCGGPRIYPRLVEMYRWADDKYNSGLFHFSPEKDRPGVPDQLTPKLKIDDSVLKDILSHLYYPDSPYEFSILPPEILGHVYEQFLGKVIRLTKGHRAKVEEKPEVRKAGGVYYTPKYIVDYIVKNTVGKLCAGKTPKAMAGLRILDPACGSGSFLLGAYQYLLDRHLEWYLEAKAKQGKIPSSPPQPGKRGRKQARQAIYEGRGGEWCLTTAEKKRILLNNLYGVDIDLQAVEVTKLALLLKVLENENSETLQTNLRQLQERALPDLAGNIKCGNSLIGPDFYDQPGQQELFADEDTQYRINAFDWHDPQHGFGAIMQAGGFDAVIGNPPYILLQGEFRDDEQLKFFRSMFQVASYKLDTYHLFIERGIKLLSPTGRISMITPANFLTNNYLADLRRFMLMKTQIDHLLVIDGGVFRSVSVDNAIFVLKAGQTRKEFPVRYAVAQSGGLLQMSESVLNVKRVLEDELALFTGAADASLQDMWDRIVNANIKLESVAKVNFGKQLRDRKEFTSDVIEVKRKKDIRGPYKACYTGRDINRYYLTWNKLACLDQVTARRGGCWDATAQNSRNKILTRQIGRYPSFGIDVHGYQCLNTIFMINITVQELSPFHIMGILNSTLIKAFWLDRFYDRRRSFPKIKGTYLKQLPIRPIDFSNKGDVAKHDRMDTLVKTMLDLHKKLPKAKAPDAKTHLERQIAATDRQIDNLVYELYGLTDEEIKIVEGAS